MSNTNDDFRNAASEGQRAMDSGSGISSMPVPLFDVKPILVTELPSSADLGSPPVVTLTFADRAQLVIEQTKLTIAVLKAAFIILETIHSINGAIVMNEPWYKSRRVWGFVALGIATVLRIFGVELPDTVTAAMPDVLTNIGTYAGEIVAGVLVIWSWIKPKPVETP
jgi:hypothetical protein